MFIELKLAGGVETVGFDASRIECVWDNFTLIVNNEPPPRSCTITLRSGARFSLPGNYEEVVDRIHKATEEAEKRAQG